MGNELDTIKSVINGNKKSIIAALPDLGITYARLARVFITQIQKSEKLPLCTHNSLIESIMACAELGLEPGNHLGHIYLVPYGKVATPIMGYRGMLEIARRSGQIKSVSCDLVYLNDKFNYTRGLEENLIHERCEDEESKWGEVTHSYFIARFTNGGHHIEVVTRSEIDKVKNKSPGAKRSDSPWNTDWEAMAKKTAVRRAFKFLPVSIVPTVVHSTLEKEDSYEGMTIDTEGKPPEDGKHGIDDMSEPTADEMAQRASDILDGNIEG